MKRRFRIGLSSSRTILDRVKPLAVELASVIGKEHVLFDGFHEAEFARPDLAFTLPSLYKEECDLVVAIFDETYQDKEWTGLEWNAIFSVHKQKESHRIMLLSIRRSRPAALFDLDGTLDVAERSSTQIASLVLERLAINEGLPRHHYASILRSTSRANPPGNGLAAEISAEDSIRDQLFFCRTERNPKNRRKALETLTKAVDALPATNMRFVGLRLAVWRQALVEARHYAQYVQALAGLQAAFESALTTTFPKAERWEVLKVVSEAAVDISQTAPGAIELNKVAAYLNAAIKQIGSILGVRPEHDHPPERLAEFLATRAKCRRALATVLHRRAQRSTETDARIRSLRRDALQDVGRAKEAYETEFTLHEYALALFAVSASPTSDNARAGLEILSSLATEPRNVLATYEYVRQLKLRHSHLEAMNAFASVAAIDSDRRRFAANLTYFVGAIIGLYYDGSDPSAVETAAMDAITWIEEAIGAGHHRAREIVDYCFLLAITGNRIDRFTAPLNEITNDGSVDWSIVGQLSFQASRGEATLREALLLGLEDALLWNRMGTLYLDFAGDSKKTIVFYDQAIRLDPRSPVFHFNKAKALVRCEGDFAGARRSLSQARRLAKNMWGWFTVNQIVV